MAWPEIRVDNCIGARAVSFSGSPALPAKLLPFATNTVKMRADRRLLIVIRGKPGLR